VQSLRIIRYALAAMRAWFSKRQQTLVPSLCVTTILVLAATTGSGQQTATRYDYHESNRALVTVGMQTLFICNGLFVSNRTLDQLYGAELKLDLMPLTPPNDIKIDKVRKTVSVGESGSGPAMRAAHRQGLGCVLMGPEQTFADLDSLPILSLPDLPADVSRIPWPDGDLIETKPLPKEINAQLLEAAADFAFDRRQRSHPSQITMSLLVVYKGEIILERYAPGVDFTTKTRTWSTAKSIAATLIGIAAGEGKLALDAPLPFRNWGPGRRPAPDSDPRTKLTLRSILNMSSGLYPVDNTVDAYVSGSPMGYFGGVSTVTGALNRGIVREPGTTFDYENYDSLLGVYALKTVIGDQQKYLEYPRRALFDRIGMRNTIAGVDRFGDYVLSSQVYTNARDLARFGLLYLNGGVWNDRRIVPESWVRFARTPAPSTRDLGRIYGGQFWLVPDNLTDLPQDAFSTAGSRGQFTIIIPSYDIVIVRRGEDWLSGDGFSNWDLTREVLKAFPKRKGGEKLD
jgi:CubicO group peptidase (beta-lactamase class C family)